MKDVTLSCVRWQWAVPQDGTICVFTKFKVKKKPNSVDICGEISQYGFSVCLPASDNIFGCRFINYMSPNHALLTNLFSLSQVKIFSSSRRSLIYYSLPVT